MAVSIRIPPLRIMGLDPGLARMGWGVIALDGNRLTHIAHGVIATRTADGLGLRLMALHREIALVIAERSPTAIAVEQAFVAKDPSAALKLGRCKPFFSRKGVTLGVQATLPRPLGREALAARLAEVLGTAPIVVPGGGPDCKRIGICTGGAGAELEQAAAEGVDTFITGEGPHWTFALAEEAGINVFYGGHYATETFGVKALSAYIEQKFGIPWEFVDHPTGL